MHVMTDFLVLKHDLGTIPSVASKGAVNGRAGRIFIALDCIYHDTVD